MQCRARAPTEYKLYKPRYRVSKHLCPGQDSRTLPMNLLHRLRDSEPESVSLSEVAMMKELVRSHVDSIKKRRERRTAARLRVEKVCVLASLSRSRIPQGLLAYLATQRLSENGTIDNDSI